MNPEDTKKMDEAAKEVQREWWKLEEQFPEATALAAFFIEKHLRAAGYKRIGKVITGRGEYANSV